MAKRPKVSMPDFSVVRWKYKLTCDKCGKKAKFSFKSRGKMRGACAKHLRSMR